jgi:hypothetical protein
MSRGSQPRCRECKHSMGDHEVDQGSRRKCSGCRNCLTAKDISVCRVYTPCTCIAYVPDI